MKVYAICRKCAEVHRAGVECPRCERRALLEPPTRVQGSARGPASSRSGTRATPAQIANGADQPARPMRWISFALVGTYVLVILILLAAALLEI